MLHVEDWAEIRRLHLAERMPIKQIARQMGISKNTVKAMLVADAPPRYRRAGTGSVVDAVEPRIPAAAGPDADDARDGDRGAGRLDAGDDGALGAGAGAAAGVPAAGPVVADRGRRPGEPRR